MKLNKEEISEIVTRESEEDCSREKYSVEPNKKIVTG